MRRSLSSPGLLGDQRGVQLTRQPRDDLVLHVEQVGHRLFEALLEM